MKRRYRSIVFFVFLCVLLSLGFELWYPRYVENNWGTIGIEEERRLNEVLSAEFDSYQREALNMAGEIAGLPLLQDALSTKGDTAATRCFDLLKRQTRPDVSLEIYDDHKQLLAWSGNWCAMVDSSRLREIPSSYVAQGPIYSYFVVSVPVAPPGRERQPEGYVTVQRLFNVNYPISNRFINNSIFASTFTSRSTVSARFDFSADAKPQSSEQLLSVSLRGADGAIIGFAYLNRPLLATRLDDIRRQSDRFVGILALVLVVILAYGLWSLVRRSEFIFAKAIFWTLALWPVRLAMLWVNFPANYFNAAIFDPSYYASSFGIGIAKSVGDLFLTSTFLCINVIVYVRPVGSWVRLVTAGSDKPSLSVRILYLLLLVLLPIFLFVLLRGFSSTVHSAVFDSTLGYNDPMYILPPLTLSVMLLALFFIAGSLLLGGILIFLVSNTLVKRMMWDEHRRPLRVLIVVAVFLVGSYAFGIVHPSPLLGQGARLAYVFAIGGLAALCVESADPSIGLSRIKSIVILVAGAVIGLIPRLDGEAHLLDRNHVELVASEIVRPVDSWLTFVLNRALDELSSSESAAILQNGEPQDIEKLAFTGWARSILSQQGYNCSVIIVNSQGDEVSDFHLGGQVHSAEEQHIEHLDSSRSVRIEERLLAGGAVKWYLGYAPIFSDSGALLGAVRVDLTADKQALLRGETPEILRNYTRENFETHHRSLVLSEYYQGRLASTTGETIPVGRELPPQVREELRGGSGVWLDEMIEGRRYETYFLRQEGVPLNDSWIALSMELLDIRWHVFSITRVVLFYLLCSLILLGLAFLVQDLRGIRPTIDFRTKLLLAFILVSFIPIAILAYYNRTYAIEHEEEIMTKGLNEQTTTVVNAVQKRLGMSAPFDLARLTNGECEEVAADLGTDFNVYTGQTLLASSKPEIFFAELLSPRFTADAFLNVVLKKRSFFAEEQSIGTLRYIVGYRPLMSESGTIIGAVAVPSLYRQEDIDESILQRNAFLFAAYALAMLISLVVGTISANQISSPLRRLKRAAQQVASGNLSPELHSLRSDEFGELERAFDRMTAELKLAQEEMVRAQRELAWKEMAKQVAHEIKNPLTPMKLSVQHLRQARKDGAKDFESLFHQITATLLDQIEALSRIASEFSRFARMPARKVEECDVHEILRDAVNLFQQYPGLDVRQRFEAKRTKVYADSEELRRAFVNVLQNAIQAMNGVGDVAITTRSAAGALEIEIADSGPGVPEGIRERLFEPNFSTKTDGMGLGLAIVKKTVDGMGGTILIESTVGKGTTVTIRIPQGETNSSRMEMR